VPRDRVKLHNIRLYGCHGVSDAERTVGRPFEVDVELVLDLTAAAATDDLRATVDYGEICRAVRTAHEAGPYHLLEALAGGIAEAILDGFPVREATVRVRKPHPPVGSVVDAAEVEITRSAEC
jgi:dihydroneopterin aldolase